jgi:hypothetical protein
MINLECHLTIDRSHARIGEAIATAMGWKTSEIARDPVLGQASYFYLTTHSTDLSTMLSRMHLAVHELKTRGVEVIREKIEAIVYDTKFKPQPNRRLADSDRLLLSAVKQAMEAGQADNWQELILGLDSRLRADVP